MLDVNNGLLIIDNELKFYPNFSFSDFKNTKYYKGQDKNRVIYVR